MALHRGAWPAFDTLYLGGGTPSALPPDALEEILAAVRTHFPLRPDAEITLEVNPGDLEGLDLRRVRGWGVGRLQVGVQSLDNGHLRFLGRRHTARQGRHGSRAAPRFPQWLVSSMASARRGGLAKDSRLSLSPLTPSCYRFRRGGTPEMPCTEVPVCRRRDPARLFLKRLRSGREGFLIRGLNFARGRRVRATTPSTGGMSLPGLAVGHSSRLRAGGRADLEAT